MPEAIIIRKHGGSEVLKTEPIEIGAPGPDQLRVRQTAIGVNFHDVYVRSGLYQTLSLPGIPGCDAVGVVEQVGENVEHLKVGARIAYLTSRYGAYASERLLDARLALPIPDELSDELVATNLLRAMTVDVLLSRVTRIKSGDTVLVHAAAGGVGRLLCQWISHLGGRVIGTVGSEAKAVVAKASGCGHTILYRETDFVESVRELTNGRGVDVAYDSVGRDTFYGSLSTLKPTGLLVNFGQSSGAVKPLEMSQLAAKSLTVCRPILFHYVADEAAYRAAAQAVFDAFEKGFLSVEQVQKIPLAEARRAHDILEARSGGGSLLLTP